MKFTQCKGIAHPKLDLSTGEPQILWGFESWNCLKLQYGPMSHKTLGTAYPNIYRKRNVIVLGAAHRNIIEVTDRKLNQMF